MAKLKTYHSYLIVMLVFALLGMGLACFAQHGGINPVNGFIAPLIGPWSRALPPNAHWFSRWEAVEFVRAVALMLVVFGSVAFADKPKQRALRVLAKVIAHAAVVFWCLYGLGKVGMELT